MKTSENTRSYVKVQLILCNTKSLAVPVLAWNTDMNYMYTQTCHFRDNGPLTPSACIQLGLTSLFKMIVTTSDCL